MTLQQFYNVKIIMFEQNQFEIKIMREKKINPI